MLEDGGSSGFGQGRGGNEGMSGAPLWQIKQRNAQYQAQREKLIEEAIAQEEEKKKPAEPPNVLVDAVSGGAPVDPKSKPYVRSVLIKDLRKIAQLKSVNVELPTAGIFKGKAPMGLYAVFDGQSCGGAPGAAAADFCARNFHLKVLGNLSQLPPERSNESFAKALLIKSFHDLDEDLMVQQAESHDGCGAAVALLVGDLIFVAVLGSCGAALGEVLPDGKTRPLALCGGSLDTSCLASPQAALQRTLGEAGRKKKDLTATTSTPEVQSVALQGSSRHPFLLLASSALATSWSAASLVEAASEFPMQPRLSCAEIALRPSAVETSDGDASKLPAQCAVAQVSFLPEREILPSAAQGGPAPKKAKVGDGSKEVTRSQRLRHILVKHCEVKGEKVTRTRNEAEVALRRAYRDLHNWAEISRGRVPKTASEIVSTQTKKLNELCRQISDCETGKKAGVMCGDLGWVSPEMMTGFGGTFRERLEPLRPGQWSDIVSSELGLHIVQRIA